MNDKEFLENYQSLSENKKMKLINLLSELKENEHSQTPVSVFLEKVL
ncbi:Uncharacterised protein [uncultured Clostridium sp.]|nr:Uncharacterised protein [uncultured Clostridium sp.]